MEISGIKLNFSNLNHIDSESLTRNSNNYSLLTFPS